MTAEEKYPRIKKADDIITAFMRAMLAVAAICILIVMCLAFFDALGSKLLRNGIPRSTEIIQYLNVPAVFLGVGFVQMANRHTRIDLVFGMFPRKIRIVIDFIVNLAVTAILLFVAWRALAYTIQEMERGTLSGTSKGFEIWPFIALSVFGWLMLAFSFLWTEVRIITGINYSPDVHIKPEMEYEKDQGMVEQELTDPVVSGSASDSVEKQGTGVMK